jgi:Protein of unknown function (DUF3455)
VISKFTPDETAIPWLLLEAASSTGDGTFSRVKYIQRLNTVDGTAPPDPCQKCELVEVDYSALYVFHSLKAPISG